jgi:hypothetical protein
MTIDFWLSAYSEPYDPRPVIDARSKGDVEAAPHELWANLYHQGTVNTPSYVAVGEIVRMMQLQAAPDWNAYALIASIEEGRLAKSNPPIPDEIEQDYNRAWSALLPLALRDLADARDDLLVRGTLAVIVHAKGQHSLATIALCTEDERAEMLGA